MGVVYRATDLLARAPGGAQAGRARAGRRRAFRRRFLEEPRLAAALDHANVVPIYEAGEHDGQLFLAMRFVEGSDLRTLLHADGGLPPERALALLAQIAGALDAAHRRGLVHRDVKPANILVDADGHAYLTDFGVSKQLGGDHDRHRADSSARSTTWRPSRSAASASTAAPTSTRSPACCTSAWPARPAFRRETEAETLWAHMQAEYRRCPGSSACFKALAKDRAAATRPARI